MSASVDIAGRTIPAPPDLLDRMVRAVEKVRLRLARVRSALEAAEIPYAIVGEQAVAAWVARRDEAAVRNSPEISILLNRSDLGRARAAMEMAAFHFQELDGVDVFGESPAVPMRHAVRIVYAGERLGGSIGFLAPEVGESEEGERFRIVGLEPLVRMKLASFRLVDRVNIRDMIDVSLVDESWLPRLPGLLSERLKELLEDPEG